MAFDAYQADRIRNYLERCKVVFEEKRMFGGLCFMVDHKMCCGLMYNKKHQTDLLMARVGEDAYPKALERTGSHPMDFTGRPLKGFVFVSPEGYDTDKDLTWWLDACLTFNPMAKRSKKRN